MVVICELRAAVCCKGGGALLYITTRLATVLPRHGDLHAVTHSRIRPSL